MSNPLPKPNITHVYGRERYYVVEADGRVLAGGYSQRPAALKWAHQTGYGLWDDREQEWVLDPVVERRRELLRGQIEDANVKLAQLHRTLIAIAELYAE